MSSTFLFLATLNSQNFVFSFEKRYGRQPLGSKGQLISKTNCQAKDSPKKRTNEFVFTTVRRVFVRFFGESSIGLLSKLTDL